MSERRMGIRELKSKRRVARFVPEAASLGGRMDTLRTPAASSGAVVD